MVGGLNKFKDYFSEYKDMRALKIKGITNQQIVNRLKKIYLGN